MASAEVRVTIDRSPDDVWALVGDFGGIAGWMPGVESCEVDGDVRNLSLMGMAIAERLIERDEDDRRLTYSIAEAPMPLDHHVAVVAVTGDGDASTVTWSVEVTPDEMLELMTGAYQGALDAAKAKLEA
jgi:mxaD protein